MLFYKIEGMLVNTGAENEDSRRAQREAARRIYMKSEDYNHKRGRDAYCFVSESSDGLLTAGTIITHESNAKSTADLICAYVLQIDCPLDDITVSEVTIGIIQQTVNLKTGAEVSLDVKGRHDPCIVPRAVPVVEAAAAIAMYDLILGNTK